MGVFTGSAGSPASFLYDCGGDACMPSAEQPQGTLLPMPMFCMAFVSQTSYSQHQSGLPMSWWRMQQIQLSVGSCIEADDDISEVLARLRERLVVRNEAANCSRCQGDTKKKRKK